MFIRLAAPADASAIARIHVETWQAAYRGLVPQALLDGLNVAHRRERWHGILTKKESTTFVASLPSGIIGFGSLMPSRDQDAARQSVAEIAALYVSPAHWRQGAGQALCAALLTLARRDGFAAVTLWVLKANTPARDFYVRVGFTLEGAEKIQNFDGHDLIEVRYRQTL